MYFHLGFVLRVTFKGREISEGIFNEMISFIFMKMGQYCKYFLRFSHFWNGRILNLRNARVKARFVKLCNNYDTVFYLHNFQVTSTGFGFNFMTSLSLFFGSAHFYQRYVFLIMFICRARGTMGTVGTLYTGPDFCFIFHTYKATFQVI